MYDLLLIFVALLLVWYVKAIKKKDRYNKKRIGDAGELIVRCELSKLSQEYRVVNDYRIGNQQIDHLVFYNNTIFVIETKHWGGIIKGNDIEDKWQQYKADSVCLLNSPVKQNERHVAAIERVYSGFNIISIIVFVGNKNYPHLPNVIGPNELLNMIRNFP